MIMPTIGVLMLVRAFCKLIGAGTIEKQGGVAMRCDGPSGDDIWGQPIFDLSDQVFQAQLALLQSLDR